MNVAIALPVLASGDAIGHDVLGMADTLRKTGHRVTLYAEKSLVAEDVQPLDSLEGDGLLIYHHSHGCEAGVRAVRNWRGRAVVKYHNVTPAKYFPDRTDVRDAAEAGLAQAEELAKIAPFWVDSAFNSSGLRCETKTLPPFMPTESLKQLDPDPAFSQQLDDWMTTFLCVGRVAPNKNLLLAIDALAAYRDRIGDARLLIAGGHVFPEYSEAVADRIREFQLTDRVAVTGRVTAAQLKALYLSADVLLVTSEHEGFCVPLVEAMALGVPTVAVPTTAIPETAGPFAVYAESDANAIANAAQELIADARTREAHIKKGFDRYRSLYTPDSIGSCFLALVTAL